MSEISSKMKVTILTGCQHDHYRLETQSDGDHREGCHCDGLDGERRCDHARNGEPRLRDEVFISIKFLEPIGHAQSTRR
jgi:hypothetical protein